MSEALASLKISIVNGEIEISGPVEFVEKQALLFKDLILNEFHFQKTNQSISGKNPIHEEIKTHNEDLSGEINNYSNLFTYDEDKLNIHLHTIPGKSKREKMVNMAYLYLFGKSIFNVNEISTDEIREACR